MQYYHWFDLCSDDPKSRDWSIEFPNWCWSGPGCNDGEAILHWDETLVARYGPEEAEPTDYPVVIGPWPVYSPRLREFMDREAPGKVQYLPFKLRASVGDGEMDGYCVANCLKIIDCLDRQLSHSANNWQSEGDPVNFAVRKRVISDRLVGDERLFRVVGDYVDVVIREDLVRSIKAAGITGCKFVPIEASAYNL